jgi:hypothetical protein
MDGYNAVLRIARQKPEYLPVVKKCIEAHQKEKTKNYSLGFEWDDVGVWPVKLLRLATEYDLLEVTYKSNSATCYMVKDIESVERALQDIEANRAAAPIEKSRAVKVWLSESTMRRLRGYIAREFSDDWDAESIVVERAVNAFLDKFAEGELTK